MKYTYYAIFTEKSNGYDVTFPGIHNLITSGDDINQAKEMAREALTICMIEYEGDNETPPSDILPNISKTGSFITKIESYDTDEYKKQCIVLPKMKIYSNTQKPIIRARTSCTKLNNKEKSKSESKPSLNKQVIIVNGNGGSGKDTFVELFQKHYKATNFSSIDVIKTAAKSFGYNGGKTEEDRKLLSDLKKLISKYNDLPFKSMKKAYDDFMDPSNESEFLFLHIREPEEIGRAVKEFNAKTLLIKNSRVDNITSNDSDKNVWDYHYDFTIMNESTIGVLEQKAIELGRILNNDFGYSIKTIKHLMPLSYYFDCDGNLCFDDDRNGIPYFTR